MKRTLPPFAAVRAFEAAARHLSVQQAADELCLTPSAVSHQIRALETFLDTALFERRGNRIALTLTGRAYAGKLTHLLDAFDASTRELAPLARGQLRVLCTPGFAARWLVPRIAELPYADGLRLRVSVGAPSVDFTTNDADVVIRWATGQSPGVTSEPLMESARFPVASPELLRRETIRTPRDLLRQSLMQDETDDAWHEWFATASLRAPDILNGPVFPNCELSTTAAERGQGVALAYSAMIGPTLESGRLVRLFDEVTMPFVIYSVAYRTDSAGLPILRHFVDWLHAQTARQGVAPRLVETEPAARSTG